MRKVLKITANAGEGAMHIYTDDGRIIPFGYFMGKLEEESEKDYLDMLVSSVEGTTADHFISYLVEDFFSHDFYNSEEGFETLYQITLH